MAQAVGGKTALAAGALFLAACGGGSAALQPPEVFRFGRAPIAFSPLGKPWSRERPVLAQGLSGVHFDLERGVAAEIDVGEYPPPRLVSARECLRAFIPKYAELSFHQGQADMQDCRPPYEPANDREAAVHREVQQRWDEAFTAHNQGDRPAAEAALAAAVEAADRLSYDIEDVALPYKFGPQRYEPQERDRFVDMLEERAVVGGQPALRLSCRVKGRSFHDRQERWVYVLSPELHLFALHYHGNEAELTTFDALVASVRFPGSP